MTSFSRMVIALALAAPLGVALAQPDKPLVYAMYADIRDWDPSIAASTEVNLLSNVYEPLVWYNLPGSKQALTPGLATAWTSNADGTEWKFTLRRNVKFHDGETFDAAAAKASIERVKKLGKGSAYIWDSVESIATPDPHTLVIKTKVPAPVDLIASSQYAAYMVSPKALAAGTDWFNQGNDGGSGPYKVKKWVRGQEVVLEKSDAYWGGWKPNQYSVVLLKVVQEAATQAQLIRSGEADFITLPSVDLVKALAKDPGINVMQGTSWKNTQFLINTKKSPTDNVQFRRALTYAWDYGTVIDRIYEGGVTRSKGVIPSSMWAYDAKLNTPSFDLAKAKQLVESSGVPKEQRKLTVAYIGNSEEYKNSLLLFKANLQKIGVELELKPGPWGKIWDDAKKPESAPNMISMTWWPTYATPSDWLIGLFRTESPTVFNLSHYSNPAYDELVNKGVEKEASDRPAATDFYVKAQQLLLDDAAAIFVADLKGRVIHRKTVKGVVLNPAYDAVNFYALSR